MSDRCPSLKLYHVPPKKPIRAENKIFWHFLGRLNLTHPPVRIGS